jgi:hypothetical protein
MTGRAGLVCVDSVRFGGAAMFFSPERTLVAGTSTAGNLLTTPTLRYCAQFRCTRATQCCSLRQAASSIELLNTAKAALSIELRANYRITEKSIGLEGLSPPMALSLAIIWLTISANRSLNQASSKQFVMSTQACVFLNKCLLRLAADIPMHSLWAAKVESRMGAVAWAMRQRSVSHARSSDQTRRIRASSFPNLVLRLDHHPGLAEALHQHIAQARCWGEHASAC